MGGINTSGIGWILLNAVADGIEIFEYSVKRPTALLQYGVDDLKTLETLRKRHRLQTELRRLEKRKLIRARMAEGRRQHALTKFGLECIKEASEYSKRPLPKDEHTVVSFDIPERFRSERQAFRRFLKQIGFRRYHLSVWISDFDCFESLVTRAKRLGVQPWVTIMRGKIMKN